MTSIRRFNYSNDKQITSQIVDEIDDFIWIVFAKNSDGNCILEKEAKFFPTQTYFSIERSVDEIVAMDLDSSNIYVAYNDPTLLGEKISKISPLTNTTQISKDSFIESPVDIKVNSSDLWFLLPGNASGTNAKLLKYNTSGVFQLEVNLINSFETINNAISMTIDDNNDIWIVTHTDPTILVRVFEISGGLFDFSTTQIL